MNTIIKGISLNISVFRIVYWIMRKLINMSSMLIRETGLNAPTPKHFIIDLQRALWNVSMNTMSDAAILLRWRNKISIILSEQSLFCSNQSPNPKAHEHKNEGFNYNEDPDVNLLIGHSNGSCPNLKHLNAIVK